MTSGRSRHVSVMQPGRVLFIAAGCGRRKKISLPREPTQVAPMAALLTACWQVIGSDEGPAGGKSLTKTTFIQRLNTKGGSAPANPATGCLASNDVGHQVLVPYSADYFFFRNEQ